MTMLGTRVRHRLIRALGGSINEKAAPAVTALAISGGGARSSFELGALTYLYEHEGIDPQIITGTSAGAILAAVIAQHRDRRDQAATVARLSTLWLSMQDTADMFTELEWFTKLNEHMPTFRKLMALRNRAKHRPPKAATQEGDDLLDEAEVKAEAHRLERESAKGGDHTSEHGLAWSVTNVLDTMSTLREAVRTRTDIEAIISGIQSQRAAYQPGPLVDQLTDPSIFDPAAVATSGVMLRIATVALESGELRYIDEHGQIRSREDEPLAGTHPVDLIEAIRASCAIPAVFAPVALGGEHYVDGGARESLPAEVALTQLGAGRCYAVAACPAATPKATSFATKDMLEIVLRAGFGIMSDEILTDEVRHARRLGAIVIQPELNIHDILTVDPGLTMIAMDYGYTRAAEECLGAPPQARERNKSVYKLRRAIWSAEDLALRPGQAETDEPRTSKRTSEGNEPPKPSEEEKTQIATLKHQLREAVCEAGPTYLPTSSPHWWRDFERHPYPLPLTTYWLD